jgi:hypothetical protein
MVAVSTLLDGASLTDETTKLNPTARRLKLAECGRGLCAVVRRAP